MTWQEDLSRLVTAAAEEHGTASVRAALAAELDSLVDPAAPVEPLRPDVPVLGLVACETGWLGVLAHRDGRLTVHQARGRESLIDQVESSVEEGYWVVDSGPDAVVADRDQLLSAGVTAPPWFSGSGFTEHDLLTACTAVLARLRE